MKAQGFTYLEMLVAGSLATIVFLIMLVVTLHSEQSFALMTSYTEMDSDGRKTLDLASREIHEATQVIASQKSAVRKSLTLTNGAQGGLIKLIWETNVLTMISQGSEHTNSRTLLEACDAWDYTLYDGAPTVTPSGVSLHPSASLASCKLVQMSWSCSRTIMGKMKTSSAESARIGLRNR